MIAHIGGLPLEEVLPVLTSAGSGLLAVRARSIMPRVRRRRELRAVNDTTLQIERAPGAHPRRVRRVD